MMRSWYYTKNEQRQGPVQEDELVSKLEQGEIGPDTLVWTKELKEWVAASDVENLFPDDDLPPPIPQREGDDLPPEIPKTKKQVSGEKNAVEKTKTQKKKRSCWFIGCGGCLTTVVLLIIAFYAFVSWFDNLPVGEAFEPLEMSEDQQTAIHEKLRSLNMLDAEGYIPEDFLLPAEGVELTELEMNYWLAAGLAGSSYTARLDFEPGLVNVDLRTWSEWEERTDQYQGQLSVKQTDFGLDVEILKFQIGTLVFSNERAATSCNFMFGTDAYRSTWVQRYIEKHTDNVVILKDKVLLVPTKENTRVQDVSGRIQSGELLVSALDLMKEQ